jgi:hypothetical protein
MEALQQQIEHTFQEFIHYIRRVQAERTIVMQRINQLSDPEKLMQDKCTRLKKRVQRKSDMIEKVMEDAEDFLYARIGWAYIEIIEMSRTQDEQQLAEYQLIIDMCKNYLTTHEQLEDEVY